VDSTLTRWRATLADAALLAAMNQQLIADEGHRNAMTLAELEARMRRWLGGRYEATLFARDGQTVAYALWREEPDWIYLCHFFVARAARRMGIGRLAMRMLAEEVWPPGKRVRVEVLVGNETGIAFWRAVGFQDYCLTLEMER
jgi:ribosomal protein S18 acetylase RimI-like enzyme